MGAEADLHDWRTASLGPHKLPDDWMMTVKDAETGALLVEWHGPAASAIAAKGLALHDARIVLKATATLCGAENAFDGPLTASDPIESIDDFGSTSFKVLPCTLSIVRTAGGTWPIPFPMPQERVDVAAHAALLAAASRAILEPNSSIGLSYGSPHDPDSGNLPFAMVRIDVTLPGQYNAMELTGTLRSVAVAMTVAGQLATRSAHPILEDEEIPGSATLRAALKADLLRQAPQRCERVCAFMRELGLDEEGEAFKRLYGKP